MHWIDKHNGDNAVSWNALISILRDIPRDILIYDMNWIDKYIGGNAVSWNALILIPSDVLMNILIFIKFSAVQMFFYLSSQCQRNFVKSMDVSSYSIILHEPKPK